MKKRSVCFTILAIIIFTARVSAIPVNISTIPTCGEEETNVKGIIYEDSIVNGVSGANVEVICHHNGNNYAKTTVSLAGGTYSVFFEEDECDYGDTVTVNAEKDSLTGSNDGSIEYEHDLCCLTLNVGIIHVPLVPEFGKIAGVLTVLSAMVVFFVIRKK